MVENATEVVRHEMHAEFDEDDMPEPTETVDLDGVGTIERWCLGRHRANSYIVYGAERRALVVDPGWDADVLLDRCRQRELVIGAVILTHAHFDHVGAAEAVSRSANVPVIVHRDDVGLLKQAPLYGMRIDGVRIEPITNVEGIDDGWQRAEANCLSVRAVHAPGHTQGGIFLLLEGAIFTGDLLLPEEAGRSDLPGGSPIELAASLRVLRSHVDAQSRIFPGHGATFTGSQAIVYIERALGVTDKGSASV